jgi:hypothetical protein
VGAKTIAEIERWLAGDVGGRKQIRPLPERQAAMRVQTWRFALARADKGIYWR